MKAVLQHDVIKQRIVSLKMCLWEISQTEMQRGKRAKKKCLIPGKFQKVYNTIQGTLKGADRKQSRRNI